MLSSSVLEDLLEFLVERFEYFRTRPLPEKLFALFIDAYHTEIREDNRMQKVSVFWLSRPDSRLVSCLYKIRQSIALRLELGENTRVLNLKKLKGGAKHENNFTITRKNLFNVFTKFIISLALSHLSIPFPAISPKTILLLSSNTPITVTSLT